MDFPQHTVDLAQALRRGDIAAAEAALDMIARDCERPSSEMIAKGRALALKPRGDPRQPNLLSHAS